MSDKQGDTPLYRLWIRTNYKCSRPNNVQYKNYGAKGVTVCKDWQDSFQSFREWAEKNGYAEGKKLFLKEGQAEFGPDTAELRFAVRSNFGWTTEQDEYLKQNYATQTRKQIAEALNLPAEAVSARVTALELNKRGKSKRHGESTSKLYKLWAGIKSRCHSPANSRYNDYGAKGITLAPEWHDWSTFKAWAVENGYDGKLLLNRKDLTKPYSPDNCVFADATMRQRRKKWPADAENFLIDNYATMKAKDIAAKIGKTEGQVLAMACLLRKRGKLTERKRAAKAPSPESLADVSQMQVVPIENSGFDTDQDELRKSIGKKDPEVVEAAEEVFLTEEELLDTVDQTQEDTNDAYFVEETYDDEVREASGSESQPA